MKKTLYPLTSLRFLAAMLIVVHHSKWYFGYGELLGRWVSLDLGVSFFYVLSGFIIYYSYWHIQTAREGADFLFARFARIWPAHAATMLVVLLFLPYPWGYPTHTTLGPALMNVALLQAWAPTGGYHFSFNGVSWSLSVEMFFYAMFPLLVWRWERTWWWKLPLCFMGAAAAIAYADMHHLPRLKWQEEWVSGDYYGFIFPPARLLEFGLGMMTGLLWKRFSQRAGRFANLQELSACVLAVAAMHCVPMLAWRLEKGGVLGVAGGKWVAEAGCAPAFCLLIYVMAGSQGLVSRVLSMRWFVFLGEISFSVYLTHSILMRSLVEGNRTLSHFGGLATQYVVYWAAVIGASTLLWVLVERPCRRYLVERYQRWRGVAKKANRAQAERVAEPAVAGR